MPDINGFYSFNGDIKNIGIINLDKTTILVNNKDIYKDYKSEHRSCRINHVVRNIEINCNVIVYNRNSNTLDLNDIKRHMNIKSISIRNNFRLSYRLTYI